jgi:hypothetical protein
MDRCRRCGYQITVEEQRERDYGELLRARREAPSSRQTSEPDERERGLF